MLKIKIKIKIHFLKFIEEEKRIFFYEYDKSWE